MKEIKLTQGKVVLVDDEDYDKFNHYKYFPSKYKDTYYAVRNIKVNGQWTSRYLHRDILNPIENMEVDHKDHDGLNCQKNNIRIVTHSQNQINRKSSGECKYLGVHKNRNNYAAKINVDGKGIYLGTFKIEEEAAIAYDIAAMKYHKEFAVLNLRYSDWFKKRLYDIPILV